MKSLAIFAMLLSCSLAFSQIRGVMQMDGGARHSLEHLIHQLHEATTTQSIHVRPLHGALDDGATIWEHFEYIDTVPGVSPYSYNDTTYMTISSVEPAADVFGSKAKLFWDAETDALRYASAGLYIMPEGPELPTMSDAMFALPEAAIQNADLSFIVKHDFHVNENDVPALHQVMKQVMKHLPYEMDWEVKSSDTVPGVSPYTQNDTLYVSHTYWSHDDIASVNITEQWTIDLATFGIRREILRFAPVRKVHDPKTGKLRGLSEVWSWERHGDSTD